MDINIPRKIKNVMSRLEEKGYESYIVGGCVRDSLMGLTPADYDITTNALPEQVKECFSDMRTIDTGLRHGTVTVLSEGENVEITTYRIDGAYKDFRRPESVSFTDKLTEDLSRRDFTVNAMAYSDKTGIIDKFGGQKDLFSHKIRCVGEPELRFKEDALRILRALRFAACLDFSIEPMTSLALHEKCGLLSAVSAERIREELVKLLCGKAPANVLSDYSDIFVKVIPEFKPCINFDAHNKLETYDVWRHTAHAVENSQNSAYIRLALFFHDIEKPSCMILDDEGEGRFPNHEKKSAETAEKIMKRLKFDNKTVSSVCQLIKYHYVVPVDDRIVAKRLLSEIGEKSLIQLLEVIKGDSCAKNSVCLERVTAADSMKITVYDILNKNECYREDMLAVNGNDIEAAGYSGKEIGDAKKKLLDLVIEGKLENTKETLLQIIRNAEFGMRN